MQKRKEMIINTGTTAEQTLRAGGKCGETGEYARRKSLIMQF